MATAATPTVSRDRACMPAPARGRPDALLALLLISMLLVSMALVSMVLLGVTGASAANAAPPAASSTLSGQAVYVRWCAPCHAPGPGHPGTQSLQVKYGGRIPAVLLERTDLAPRAVARFVREGVLSMTPFRKTEITDADLAALASYVASNYKAP